jgi:hypothetical protein
LLLLYTNGSFYKIKIALILQQGTVTENEVSY